MDKSRRPEIALVEARLLVLPPLAGFADKVMRKHVGRKWIDIARNASATNVPSALDEAITVADLDDASVLRVILRYWSPAFTAEGFRPKDRSTFETLLSARNVSAHPRVRPVERQLVQSWLTTFASTMDRIKHQEVAAKIRELKASLSDIPDGKPAEDVAELVMELRNRIVDEIQTEFSKKNDAGAKAGQLIVDRLESVSRAIQSLEDRVGAFGDRLGLPNEQPVKVQAAPSKGPPSLEWAIRRNPNGTYSAWATGLDGFPKYRLALTASHIQDHSPELQLAADIARGRWHTVADHTHVAFLQSEANITA